LLRQQKNEEIEKQASIAETTNQAILCSAPQNLELRCRVRRVMMKNQSERRIKKRCALEGLATRTGLLLSART
jgi:hypothetical protein